MTETAVFASTERAASIVRAYRTYLGKAEELLDNADITDVWRNPQSDHIWAVSAKTGKFRTSYTQTTEGAEQFCGHIVAAFGREFSDRFPILEAHLPYHGARFTAMRRPVAQGVAWVIRRPNERVIGLEEYLEAGVIPDLKTLQNIRKMIADRMNVLIAGPMGAGKTTLLNSLLLETAMVFRGRERFILIEDTDELRCPDPDHIKMMVGPNQSWTDLIGLTLRTSATRIILGELRAGARPLLEAWQTGHSGNFATIHGSTPTEVMRRLESLLLKEGAGIDRHEIAATIHGLIIIRKIGVGRIIRDVVRIGEPTAEGYAFTHL